ncbi:MAG TPA: hypothetical protein VIF64_07415 [Pyrinomonadaceae bacterium]|jgi:hypothetical protein
MKKSKLIVPVIMLLAFSMIGVSAQTKRQANRITDRQVSGILQRLQKNASRFGSSLNRALIQEHIDEALPPSEINLFKPAFDNAIHQFRDRFTSRRAVAADVQNILQRASLVNGFMTTHRLNPQVQTDWTTVKTDLNALANAYGVSWQWNRQTLPPVTSNQPARLSDSELGQLIQQIDIGGDTFRGSLTDAFGESRYDQTGSETNMNRAVRSFKHATDELRNQFDARQPVNEYVERVLARATPIDAYMRNNRLTNQAQSDWATLRRDLNTLAGAYNLFMFRARTI